MTIREGEVVTVRIGRPGFTRIIGARVLRRFNNGRLYVEFSTGQRRNIAGDQIVVP